MSVVIHPQSIVSYRVSVLKSAAVKHERWMFVVLNEGRVVQVRFVQVQPPDWLTISPTSATVHLPVSMFDDIYHMLQTEKPVYFYAQVPDDPVFRLAYFSTSPEPPGEGLVDASA
jgi:hypothetical protein